MEISVLSGEALKSALRYVCVYGGLLLLFTSRPSLAGELVLNAPNTSTDGSYILRLEAPVADAISSVELFRNLDGGEYELLVTVPVFTAISQLVNRNGVYGYKIRSVKSDGLGKFSDAVYVSVQSESIRLHTSIPERPEKTYRELSVGSR